MRALKLYVEGAELEDALRDPDIVEWPTVEAFLAFCERSPTLAAVYQTAVDARNAQDPSLFRPTLRYTMRSNGHKGRQGPRKTPWKAAKPPE